jgi:hypothetical protein
VVTDIRRAWDNATAYLGYLIMILRRATCDRVIPCEGRITIAPCSSDRSGCNARCRAATEIEMQRKPGSHVAVDELDSGHTAASVAGQGQVAGLD